jgi:hypothetical protein
MYSGMSGLPTKSATLHLTPHTSHLTPHNCFRSVAQSLNIDDDDAAIDAGKTKVVERAAPGSAMCFGT